MGHKGKLKMIKKICRKAQADMFAEMYGKGPAEAEEPVNQEDDKNPYGMDYGLPPQFKGKSPEIWFAEMAEFLHSVNVWHLIENGFDDPCVEAKDALALSLIHQAFDDDLFHLVAAATTAKEAWENLKMEFDVRGSDTNQHQAELLRVALVEEVSSVREIFDETNEELLVETEEMVDVLMCAGKHEDKEDEFHCIDISVDDDQNDVCFEQQPIQCLSDEFKVTECEVGQIPVCESEIERCLMIVPESTIVFADEFYSFAGISENECNHDEDVANTDVKNLCSTEVATDICEGIIVVPAAAKEELTGVAVKGFEDASVCITEHDEFHCVETHMNDNEVIVLAEIEDKEVAVVMDKIELFNKITDLHVVTVEYGENDGDEADIIISEFLECLNSLSEVKSEFKLEAIAGFTAALEIEPAIEFAEDMNVFIHVAEIDCVEISHDDGARHVPRNIVITCEAVEAALETHVDDEEFMRSKLMRLSIFLNNWNVFECAVIAEIIDCSSKAVTDEEEHAVAELVQHEDCIEPEETLKKLKLKVKKQDKFSQRSVKTKLKKRVRRIPEFKIWSRKKKKRML